MSHKPYVEYGQAYYFKNKKRILERTREYRKKYGHEYYLKNKQKKKELQKQQEEAVNKLLDKSTYRPIISSL